MCWETCYEMRMSTARALGLAFLSLSLIGASNPPKYKIHWYLGHKNLDYFEEAAQNFKKAVETKSHGDIAVDIVAGRDNGTEASPQAAEVAGLVERGEVEMGHSFVDVMGALDPRMNVFETPY